MVVDDDDDGGGGVVPHGRRCSLSDRGMAAMAESLQLALSLSSSIASVVGGRVASWPCCGVDDDVFGRWPRRSRVSLPVCWWEHVGAPGRITRTPQLELGELLCWYQHSPTAYALTLTT